MRLLQQPEDGVSGLLQGINSAQRSIDMVIFRFDHPEIEKALASAVSRGVAVQALIANVNGSGEDDLRKLETRLLAAGATVARTAESFVRYHSKLMVVDHAELYLLAFNFTKLDIHRSRSFGVVVKDSKVVREGLRLIDADAKRQAYESALSTLIVSPANARKELSAFLEGAQRELLIYDPKISDRAMIRLLQERAKANVDIRVIGHSPVSSGFNTRRLISPRLHARAIVRDREAAFVGSQSLRGIELDRRREAGMIFHDAAAVSQLAKTFEEDWTVSKTSAQRDAAKPDVPQVTKLAKKIAKAVVKELPPVTPMLEVTIKELGADSAELPLDAERLEETVRDAVKDAVKEALEDAVEQTKPA